MDSFDEFAAPVCQTVIDQVEGLKHLPHGVRKYFSDSLRECADKSQQDKSPESEKEVRFNANIAEIGQKFFMHTGQKFRNAKIVFRSVFDD